MPTMDYTKDVTESHKEQSWDGENGAKGSSLNLPIALITKSACCFFEVLLESIAPPPDPLTQAWHSWVHDIYHCVLTYERGLEGLILLGRSTASSAIATIYKTNE